MTDAVLERPTVVVVGAGFSGLLTALHLLRAPDGPRVRLCERRPRFARGAAYSTSDAEHLLNVRAGNMSAFADAADHFLRWLETAPCAQGRPPGPFVSRGLYGSYLQGLLRSAAEGARAGRLILEADGVEAVRRDGAGWRVRLDVGREFGAEAVVLAVGNLPPQAPPGFSDAALSSAAYVADPWGGDVDRLPHEGQAVLLGTGLTMVDAALRLARERPGLRLLAVSRRGLLPRRHLGEGPAPAAMPPPRGLGAAALARTLRVAAQEADWRAVVDGLRPHVQDTWREWPLEERERFLRHLRPWWDVHRHRLAPAVATKLDHLTASGGLSTAAGRVEAVEPAGRGLAVAWSPRGTRDRLQVHAAAVVNCTGPNGDLDRVRDPLLRGLADAGLIRADACRLGLEVDAAGRLVGRDGRANPTLLGVGPLTRGAFWEITSVPDIRVQAAACAATLLDAVTCA